MANYGLQGGNLEWEGIPILSNGLEGGYADPIVHGHIRSVQPDLIITIFDIWALKGKPFPMPRELEHMAPRWAAWTPIDHDPFPGKVGLTEGNHDVIQRITYPIAMSAHGQASMEADGVTASYIPHGVEKDYHYTSAGRREFRRLLELPEGAILYGSVGLNRNFPNRKGLDRLIAAFAQLPSDAYLYLHTLPNSQAGSIDLNRVVDHYGVADRVKFADPYNYVLGLSQEGMNAVYSAIDCYVQPTMGEGFGLPVLEAQACGCPVIATDCTSMPELVSPNSSELVKAEPFFGHDIGYRYLVDIDDLAQKMLDVRRIYREDRSGYESMRANAGKWANNWDWDTVYRDHWRPFLADIARDVERAPRKKWHRGMGLVTEHEDYVRKQDSNVRSPAVRKELVFVQRYQGGPGIIPILRTGVDEVDGTTWFDMPKMTPLRDLKPEEMTDEAKQKVISGVEASLNYLHEQGMAHRDVCPENVVVDAEGNPYLIDFEWSAHCAGDACVDFAPWDNLAHCVPAVQTGSGQRGFHTIVQYIRGIDLSQKTHGHKGVPYQQIDGSGERDCQPRWDAMKPDVKGKTVLDVGCNLGWFVRKSLEEGATTALGLDSDLAVIESAATLGRGVYASIDLNSLDRGNDTISFTPVGSPDEDAVMAAFPGTWDVAFALSVLQHLQDPDRVLRWLVEHADTIYIEQPPRFITDYMASVLQGSEYLGESERGRPLYRVKVREAVAA